MVLPVPIGPASHSLKTLPTLPRFPSKPPQVRAVPKATSFVAWISASTASPLPSLTPASRQATDGKLPAAIKPTIYRRGYGEQSKSSPSTLQTLDSVTRFRTLRIGNPVRRFGAVGKGRFAPEFLRGCLETHPTILNPDEPSCTSKYRLYPVGGRGLARQRHNPWRQVWGRSFILGLYRPDGYLIGKLFQIGCLLA
jgi:hypothetical protein